MAETPNQTQTETESLTGVVWAYEVWDIHTGSKVGSIYATHKAANRRADRLNLAYGAHRYSVDLTTYPDTLILTPRT